MPARGQFCPCCRLAFWPADEEVATWQQPPSQQLTSQKQQPQRQAVVQTAAPPATPPYEPWKTEAALLEKSRNKWSTYSGKRGARFDVADAQRELAARAFDAQVKAACKVQAWFRGTSVRKACAAFQQCRREAAVLIQAAFRFGRRKRPCEEPREMQRTNKAKRAFDAAATAAALDAENDAALEEAFNARPQAAFVESVDSAALEEASSAQSKVAQRYESARREKESTFATKQTALEIYPAALVELNGPDFEEALEFECDDSVVARARELRAKALELTTFGRGKGKSPSKPPSRKGDRKVGQRSPR